MTIEDQANSWCSLPRERWFFSRVAPAANTDITQAVARGSAERPILP